VTLRPYSARPGRLALQLLADAAVLVWIYVWYRVGRFVHDSILTVADVGYALERNTSGLAGNLDRAGSGAQQVPVFGEALGDPLQAAGAEVGRLAAAGRDAGDRVAVLAAPVGWLVALVPILAVVLVWLALRLRFARRAGTAAALAGAPAGTDLLALRALSSRPVAELTAVAPDPVASWRERDEAVLQALAALELYGAGVQPRRRTRVRAASAS
jgi:hypothetical protein